MNKKETTFLQTMLYSLMKLTTNYKTESRIVATNVEMDALMILSLLVVSR